MTDASAANVPSVEELEAVFVGNPDMIRIKAHLSRFNPLSVMNIKRMEIRHSAVLAWLLDPAETHSLGDQFLKDFLCEVFRGQSARGKPDALDIARSDLTDAEVRREWRNIDVFVRSPGHGWAFVIENKFGSTQHSGQLERYLDDAVRFHEGRLGGVATRGIFLTLNEEEPEDERYLTASYELVYSLVSRVLDSSDARLGPEVGMFLKHYADILAEATGVSTQQQDMEELARQLYRENKRVLDFVIEHGTASDLALAADSFWSERPDRFDAFEMQERPYRFVSLSSRYFAFLPDAWLGALEEDTQPWAGCENWWAGLPVICFLELSTANDGVGGRLSLVAEVGPIADHPVRTDMIERIAALSTSDSKLRIAFSKGATVEGRQYSRFFKRNKESVEDVQDADALTNAALTLLKRFRPEMDAVAQVLAGFAEARDEAL
ncbi:PD-(D/E)XK nuclease family protein [Parvularcula oceani]|uniref:PDDEXK-like family protein n=1 Tax=Parvularcula oceani TaxID=1247963 RepID=UPI0004E278DF|nr:PD-(D/E)XK nuclease family protein [Parvularcula oceani]